MTLSVTHAFVSGVADDPTASAAGEVLPSHWNAQHVVTGVAGGGAFINVFDYMSTAQIADATAWTGLIDLTTPISNAIAAIPSHGGVLFFPPGRYVTSGGFTLANETTVMGCGMGDNIPTGAVSQIECNSGTATLFTVTALAARFQSLSLLCSAGTVTAGTAILTNGASQYQKVDYRDISVSNFYDGIDIKVGNGWSMENCTIQYVVRYGIRIRNTVAADTGDWSIVNCSIAPAPFSLAGIQYESSGGGKIANVKIQNAGALNRCQNGINVAIAGSSSQLEITNCGIENVTFEAIKVTIGAGLTWRGIAISNCYFNTPSTTAAAIKIDGTGGTISDVTIGQNNVRSTGAAASAIIITNCTNVVVGMQTNDGFGTALTQSGNTNLAAEVIGSGTWEVITGGVDQLDFNISNGSCWTMPGNSNGLVANFFQGLGPSGTQPNVDIALTTDSHVRLVFGITASDNPFLAFGTGSAAVDTSLSRQGAAGIFGIQNRTIASPASLWVYKISDAQDTVPTANYERAIFDWTSSPGVLSIGSQANGTGKTRPIKIIAGDGTGTTTVGSLDFDVTTTDIWTANTALAAGGVVATADPGGTASTNTMSSVNSTTIGAGTGTVKMSSANNANNTGWLKCYIGTQVAWIPCWTTNSP